MLAQARTKEESNEALLARADEVCRENKLRLTPMRERVYRELVTSGGPVGAYDLVDRLSSKSRRIAPVTIYRALDFLREAGLVHRLATQNSYIVSHGQPEVSAMKVMFVCTKTGNTVELHSKEVAEAIRKAAEEAGFKSISPFIEVEGEMAR
ncbi:Fur family transcriptional regulator [Microvirga pudoricolor]|jgi:Fur family zinc uptake transcriptional regulator|uniref:Fur family transcriptional regulator n=1 Tax=Microvirga pudoricolor TaxID=2778729 RepID=UPI00194E00D2|nr:Fur family transcriptional regulator [Microvirga pudoricolor]MBM6594818.1 transcriptional repressor [Microvirga pudoricolor]